MSDKDLLTTISQELAGTRYASSLTPLSGGTANFVYRAQLDQPLPDGTKSVILKHTEAFIALNREFKLPAERCLFEESILKTLDGFSSVLDRNKQTETHAQEVTVKTPRLFSFNRETNTAVMEDLPDSQDLKSFLISTAASNNVTQKWASSIGRALGNWLQSFHHWADNEAQAGVAAEMDKNQYMRDLKFMVNYDALVNSVDKYQTVLGDSRDVFNKVREMAAAELKQKDGEGFGIIHGDFWSGNVLIPKTAVEQPDHLPLFIIDWELCHCGARALDLGQMFAELYMLKHFKNIDAGTWIIQGIVDGYQGLDDEMAFRVLIHVGVHFIAWGPLIPGWGTSEQVEDVVCLGRDMVTKAWGKDKSWFEGLCQTAGPFALPTSQSVLLIPPSISSLDADHCTERVPVMGSSKKKKRGHPTSEPSSSKRRKATETAPEAPGQSEEDQPEQITPSEAQPQPTTPSQAQSLISRGSSTTDLPFRRRDDPDDLNRYEDLKQSIIMVDVELPDDIKKYVTKILGSMKIREAGQSKVEDSFTEQITKINCRDSKKHEWVGAIHNAILGLKLENKAAITTVEDQVWHTDIQPKLLQRSEYTSKPDICVGLCKTYIQEILDSIMDYTAAEAFWDNLKEEYGVIGDPYAESQYLRFPFFILDIQSGTDRSTLQQAQNRAAVSAAGALWMIQMLSANRRDTIRTKSRKSIDLTTLPVFSIVSEGATLQLWVHYQKRVMGEKWSKTEYYSAHFVSWHATSEEVRSEILKHVYAILRWGIGEYKDKVVEALKSFK
ncbi:hypothetical protein AbraCBS73388_008925 [Aspergillus brasiliensis]|uniref:Aminoglycoside phosphotransferase domain-containing protein n=1 Tax=Aspergillus brasiliensis TaxID=319629 RepID=A0A9W5YSH9_9EURO|nr:hypothetical protein AbraCBS73388_008925 [Aspergillus brasiliensis]